MKCLHCQKLLTGKRSKYCSKECQNRHRRKYTLCQTCNKPLQAGQAKHCEACTHFGPQRQRQLGLIRKRKLLSLKGGGCCKCGYQKCLRALAFHHRDRTTKEFCLDVRNLANRSWASILIESNKCDVVCQNCHAEIEELHDLTGLSQLGKNL